MLFSNQEMMLLWPRPWTRTAMDLTSVSLLRIPRLSFIQLHLALGTAAEMKLGYTLTLVKDSLVIRPWTSATACSLANDLYYWSQTGADLCFDPLFKAYLELTWSLCLENPVPSSFLMQPKNMHYYRGPHVMSSCDTVDTADAIHCQAIVPTLLLAFSAVLQTS